MVSVFRFSRSKSHFLVPKSGHFFYEKCQFSSAQKWNFECLNLTTFLHQHPPKNGGFQQLSRFSWSWDGFHFFGVLGLVLEGKTPK